MQELKNTVISIDAARLRKVIPADMQACVQWVIWRCKVVNGRKTKVPYQAKYPLVKASVTDSVTWATFEQALSAMDKADGIGFVFNGNGFIGIDVDHCFDAPVGEMSEVANAILDMAKFLGAYVEYSPSKSGFHVILKGAFFGKGKRKDGVEIYCTERFFTMTGDVYGR